MEAIRGNQGRLVQVGGTGPWAGWPWWMALVAALRPHPFGGPWQCLSKGGPPPKGESGTKREMDATKWVHGPFGCLLVAFWLPFGCLLVAMDATPARRLSVAAHPLGSWRRRCRLDGREHLSAPERTSGGRTCVSEHTLSQGREGQAQAGGGGKGPPQGAREHRPMAKRRRKGRQAVARTGVRRALARYRKQVFEGNRSRRKQV